MIFLCATKTLIINMSTKTNNLLLEQSLARVNNKFRSKLIHAYLEIKRDYAEARYESAGIKCGKFCEILVRLLQHEVTGTFIAFNKSIPNMADACRELITAQNTNVPGSIKNLIPRALIFLYTMRNKRGIGHIGGDIDANSIDMETITRVTDWVVCELIRTYHNLPIEEAQDLIDSISVKTLPIIWEIAGKRRVLSDGLTSKQKVLLLLYSQPDIAVPREDLCSWVEYSPSMFATRVLNDLHQKKLIEYDRESELVYLSPKGAKMVEEELL